MSGRDIFNHRSLTGQNRSPIEDLKAYALAGLRGGDALPVDPDEIGEALLVDGPVVTFDGVLLPDVFAESEAEFIQYIRTDGVLDFRVEGYDLTRVLSFRRREWKQTEGRWFWQDVRFDDNGKEKERSEAVFVDAEIYVYPNDRGILYPAQETFWNLEENKRTQRTLMRGSSTLPIIDSDTPSETWSAAFREGKNAIIAPYDKINYPVASSTMSGLQMEANSQLSYWLDALNVVEKDSPERPSGRDREMRTRVMINFVRKLRGRIAEVAQGAFGVTLEFNERVIATSAQERMQEYELIKLLEQDKSIDTASADELKRNLV